MAYGWWFSLRVVGLASFQLARSIFADCALNYMPFGTLGEDIPNENAQAKVCAERQKKCSAFISPKERTGSILPIAITSITRWSLDRYLESYRAPEPADSGDAIGIDRALQLCESRRNDIAGGGICRDPL